MEVKDRGYFSEPPKIQTPIERRDKRKYYRFHRDYGHNTNECQTLKDEIETLIRRGYLSRYMAKKVDHPKPTEEKATKQPQDNRPTVGVILTIYDGKASTSDQKLKL